MQSGSIPDSQITASSHRNNNNPQYGRLKNSKAWCAKEKKQTEYLQIDIGKVCDDDDDGDDNDDRYGTGM